MKGKFLVSWFVNHNRSSEEPKTKRFLDKSEDHVDGFVEGLKEAGYLKVYKEEVA